MAHDFYGIQSGPNRLVENDTLNPLADVWCGRITSVARCPLIDTGVDYFLIARNINSAHLQMVLCMQYKIQFSMEHSQNQIDNQFIKFGNLFEDGL